MKILVNFFFSFDKLMKEKLVLPFFWLVVIAWGMDFFATALEKISLGRLAMVVDFFKFFVTILLALVFIRLICELAVAIFRINDNLSPDGGRSETANIDPMAEARKVAEAAAERARDAAKVASEKTQAATKSARESMSGIAHKSTDTVTRGSEADVKTPPSRSTAPQNPVTKAKRAKASVKSTVKKAASKTTLKSGTAQPNHPKGATQKKRGPKSGVKVRRDAEGRLLKKDGTLRAKPGPKA